MKKKIILAGMLPNNSSDVQHEVMLEGSVLQRLSSEDSDVKYHVMAKRHDDNRNARAFD